MTSDAKPRPTVWVNSVMFLLGTGLLGILSGCSSFDRDWENPGSPGASSEGLAGRWEGTWTSEASGHTGGLRLIMTSKPDGGFDARYHATYRWCLLTLSFEYTVPMTAQKQDGIWKFQGRAELSCWIGGGEYVYEGQATASDFTATYRSSEDHGVFNMNRAR